VLVFIIADKVDGLPEFLWYEFTKLIKCYFTSYDWTDLKGLEYVFGKHRVNTHFHELSGDQQARMNRKLWVDQEEEAEMHIVCSSFADATDVETMLHSKFGRNNVHPAYSSQSNDDMCFVLSSLHRSVGEIESSEHIRCVSTLVFYKLLNY
jgi:hypothetical protein